jgi:hypothetical protein
MFVMNAMVEKFLSYLLFWKKSKTTGLSFNLRMMHSINRISILMFALALVFMAVKYLLL